MKFSLSKFEKFLLFFSSEDIYVIEKYLEEKVNDKKESLIRYYFLIIGLSVLVFFIFTTISTTFFIYNIFDGYSRLLSIPIGIFIGLLIANIYLFLLYTITPVLYNTVDKKKRKNVNIKDLKTTHESNLLSFSFLFRIGFIAFIALLIAQPFNVWLLFNINPFQVAQKQIVQVENYKTQSILESYIINDEHYNGFFKEINNKRHQSINNSAINPILHQTSDNKIIQKEKEDIKSIKTLKLYKNKLQKLNSNFLTKEINYLETNDLINDINILIERIFKSDEDFLDYLRSISNQNSLNQDVILLSYLETTIPFMVEKIESHKLLKELLDNNRFYTLKIKLLMSSNLYALMFSIFNVVLFCFPVLAKFQIRKKFHYYKFRSSSENTIIKKVYENHCIAYSQILSEKITEERTTSKNRIKNKLEKLEEINKKKYDENSEELDKILAPIIIDKYQYWVDAPFRTLRSSDLKYPNKEKLIEKFYK